MALLKVLMSIDGKLINDPLLCKEFKIPDSTSLYPNIQILEELFIVLLPIIIGGSSNPTLSGFPGDFLKMPIEFSLVSKKVKKNICYLHFKKSSKPDISY